MEVLELHMEKVNTESIANVFESVYEPGFLEVAKYISKNGGTFEDARDIFHDALVIFYEKRDNCKHSEISYITGIAKHLWIHKFKKDVKSRSISEDHSGLTSFDEPSLNEQKLLNMLARTGKRCLDLLTIFYAEKVSLAKIASMFNFSSEHSASAQKYKCIEKVRAFIKDKSIVYEDFFE
jgi:DNA-directed RNA polymerase specialized sigma24 family protein